MSLHFFGVTYQKTNSALIHNGFFFCLQWSWLDKHGQEEDKHCAYHWGRPAPSQVQDACSHGRHNLRRRGSAWSGKQTSINSTLAVELSTKYWCLFGFIVPHIFNPLFQARIVAINASYFLKNGGNFVISIKANCIDSTAEAEAVFAGEVKVRVTIWPQLNPQFRNPNELI